MGNKYKRFLILLATLVMLVSALAPAAFAEDTEEPVCYNHGDVNGDGVVDSNDAIYTLYSSLFGTGRYPVSQDCDFNGDGSVDSEDAIYVLYASIDVTAGDYPLKGVIHSYYDPTWKWDESTKAAEVTFKCGCGEEHTFSSADVGSVEITINEVKATCVAAGSVEYAAKVTFGGVEYSNSKKFVIPAGIGHQMVGTQDCTNGSECELCDFELPALGHKWVLNAEKSTAATCQAQATRVYECACGETKTVTLEGTVAHTYTYMVGEDLDKGECKFVKQYKCSACGDVIEGTAQSDTYYKHTYTATLTKEATCSEAGEKTYTCGVCGDSYTEAVAKNDSHKWIEGDTVENVTSYTCEYCDASKTSVSVSNNQAVYKSVLESAKELQLDNNAAISLDEATLEALDSEKQIQISVAPADLDATGLTEEEKSQVGDNTVYDFTMAYSDGTPVTEFAGEVTISLPYTLGEGEDIDSIDVWYIDDEGKLTQVFGTYSNGFVTFTTTHFSYYTVTRLTPVQRCERYGHIKVDSQKQATCTEDGYNMSVCQRCGVELAKEVLPMSGHNYVDTENGKAPTCAEDGYSEQKCENCDDVQKGTIPALGHELALDAEQSVAASCAAPGKDVYVCGRACGHTYVDEKPQLEHIYVESEIVEPDCTNKGYRKNECSLCGNEEVASESAPTGHDYQTANAVWEWASDYSSATVTLVCSHNDQHTKTLNAVINEKTVSASCTDSGSVVYTATASFNNATYTDSRTATTAALGHKPGTEWKSTAAQHYHECSICGGKADAVAHTWGDMVVTKEATCNAAGSYTVACTVCGYEIQESMPATGKHNYVNDVCADCGFALNECDHLRMYSVPAELGDHDVCGEFEIWYQSCACGERRWLEFLALDCTWGEETEEEVTTEDGQKYFLYSRTCTVCEMTMESAWYSEVDEEACTMNYYDYYHFSQNGKTILEDTCKSMISWTHPETVLVDEVDLSEYGLCGGVLEIRGCPCGDVQYVFHIESVPCDWIWDDVNSTEDTTVHVCSVCGVQETYVSEYVQDAENPCFGRRHHKTTYSKDGQQLYAYEEHYSMGMHNFETTGYEMDGTSCEDGVMISQTCSECGEESKYYTTWHDSVIFETIDVSGSGMCYDRIGQWTCACDAKYGNYYYESDDGSYCNWQQIGYQENPETYTYQCAVCGATRTETYTYGEKDQNCLAICTETAVFANQKGETIATVYDRGNRTNHNMQQRAELKGDSCEDGVTVTHYCADCDYSWSSEYNHHVGLELATYDMSGLDICGELLIEIYGCACGQDTWMNWDSNDCYFNWVDSDADSYTYQCNNCGAIENVEYVDGEQVDNCHQYRHATVTFTDKNEESVSFAFDRLYEQHREIFHLTLAEGATDCTGGVTIVRECLDCGEKTDWGTTDEHSVWVVDREIIAEGKLCGTLELEICSCACGQESWQNTYWAGDDSCNFQWVEWSEEYDAHVYGCEKCGAYYVETSERTTVEGATCEYIYSTVRTYYDKAGTELDVVIFERTEYDHRMVCTFQMQGATCDDGYTVTRTCVDCGTSYDEDSVYTGCNNWIVERKIVAEGKLCGRLEQMIYQCPCGQSSWKSMSWSGDDSCDFQWVEWSDEYDSHVYACTKCGAFYTEHYEETLVEGTTCEYLCTEIRTYYDKAGTELDSVSYSRTGYSHRMVATFQMQGETCADGYTATETCVDCGTSYGDDYVYTECNSWVVDREIIAEGKLCGTLEQLTRQCACGQNRWYDTNWLDDTHCNFQWGEWSDEYDSHVYACDTCGVFYVENSEKTPVEGTTCEYTYTDITTYYDKDGVLLDTMVFNRTEYIHRTVSTFQMQGETCEDGYYRTAKCLDCDYSYVESDLYTDHHTWTTERYYLEDYGMCDGELWKNSCACGQHSDWNWNYDCSYSYTNKYDPETGIEERYCPACKTSFYLDESGEYNRENCRYEGEFYFKAVRDEETLLTVDSTYGYVSHSYLAENFALDDPDAGCEGGYTVELTCAFCGDSYTESSSWHNTYITNMLDLGEFNACSGYIYVYECACGDEGHISTDYDCDMNHVKSWNEKGLDGEEHHFEKYICKDCGLIRIHEWYELDSEDSCDGVHYYNDTFQMADTLDETLSASYRYENHNFEHTYELEDGSVTCEDGIRIYGVCKDCGATTEGYSDYHGMNLTESIDLTAYGSICGGSLDLYQCACGERKTYEFSDELLCDLDERHVDDWIEGSLYDSQPTTEWWQGTYSESYTFTCAVTDPTACGLKIRMSEYWLKEGCEAVEYQTWQLGYDAATDTCQKEITIATGECHAYHGYTVTNIDETQDDGTQVYGTDYTCPDCGSYFVDKNFYVNGEQVKRTVDAVNTLNNNERQKMSEITEYGYEYGDYRYRSYERYEYTYSDGDEYWGENTWTYDFSQGCYAYRTHTDSNGSNYTHYEEAHLGSWDYETIKQSTCSQFGEAIGRETCQVCGEVYYEYEYDIEPTKHYWNWDESLQLYVCSTCGLENVNGASGAITMEDMTETYGNGTQYVIGYWNSDAIRFNPYVSVILDDVTDENNELVLTGITFTYWTVKDNGVTALVFDQATAQAAAEAAVAEAGYTGSYAIRISFVPINSDDTLDYAITFDSQIAA